MKWNVEGRSRVWASGLCGVLNAGGNQTLRSTPSVENLKSQSGGSGTANSTFSSP